MSRELLLDSTSDRPLPPERPRLVAPPRPAVDRKAPADLVGAHITRLHRDESRRSHTRPAKSFETSRSHQAPAPTDCGSTKSHSAPTRRCGCSSRRFRASTPTTSTSPTTSSTRSSLSTEPSACWRNRSAISRAAKARCRHRRAGPAGRPARNEGQAGRARRIAPGSSSERQAPSSHRLSGGWHHSSRAQPDVKRARCSAPGSRLPEDRGSLATSRPAETGCCWHQG